MSNPFISAIIPAYNGEAFLAEALESIKQQNYHPLEIILVDDGSTDGTAQVAASFKEELHYVYQPNSGGPATGRNRGLKLARGEFIGFLDQDDLWPSDKLAIQVPRLIQDPTLEVVLGRTKLIRPSRSEGDSTPKFEEFQSPQVRMLLSCAIFRASVFHKIGFFDETLKYFSDDMDWFMRARELGVSMTLLEEITLIYRFHTTNASRDQSIRDHALLEVLKQSLERRRRKDDGSVAPVPRFSDFVDSFIKDREDPR